MQVPTTRSPAGWGIGDLADVRAIGDLAATSLGAGVLALSPLHAPTPVPPSRRVRTTHRAGAGAARCSSASTRSPVRHLTRDRRAGRSEAGRPASGHRSSTATRCGAVSATRSSASGPSRCPPGREALERWRALQGRPSRAGLATARSPRCTDLVGRRWPHDAAPSRWHRSGARPLAPVAERVAFHAWLQLLARRQLRAANVGEVRLIQDLAVGVDPDGADAWLQQDLLALDVSVGAAPGRLRPRRPAVGPPPVHPVAPPRRRLPPARRAAPRVDGARWRAARRPRDGPVAPLLDPGGDSPADGHLRPPPRTRAARGARPGERSGRSRWWSVRTSAPSRTGFRARAAARPASCRHGCVWFEDDPPEHYPAEALAMVTTHDLPTIAGVWTGADEAELDALGRPTPDDERSTLRRATRRARRPARTDAPAGEVIDAVHLRLGRVAGRARAGHPRGPLRGGAPTQRARHHDRATQLVAGPAPAGGGPHRGPDGDVVT